MKYKVKRGDTVSGILLSLGSTSYGKKSSWQAVSKASGLADYNKINIGQSLTIPDTLLGKSGRRSTKKAPAKRNATAGQLMGTPANSKEMADYLNKSQEELDAIKNYDPFSGQSPKEAIDEFTSDKLGMEGEMPLAPKYEETFEKLRSDMGLDTVESSINEYKDMIRDQENLLMQQKGTERAKTNRLGVIEGRIDKATQDRQEQISWLSSNVSYLTDVANSAYTLINMTMNFKQMDYNTAKEAYDSEFTKRMSVYDSLVETARDERDFKLALKQEQQKVASTQLTMYADMITSGQISWKDLSNTEQLQVHKLEVQAGLPVGFTGKIKIPKGATIKSITNRHDKSGQLIADIIYVDPYTGKVNVEHKKLGSVYQAPRSSGSSGGLTYTQKKAEVMEGVKSTVSSGMQKSMGKDQKVSPTTYNANRAYYIKKGGSGVDFDKEFAGYINESHYWNVRDGVWKGANYNTSIQPAD